MDEAERSGAGPQELLAVGGGEFGARVDRQRAELQSAGADGVGEGRVGGEGHLMAGRLEAGAESGERGDVAP